MPNVFSFTGRIGRDAERKVTQGGQALLCFPVANDAGYGDHKTTNWLNCQIWGKRADGGLADLLTKGTKVFISGELTLRPWDNKDGVKQISPDVNVTICELIGDKKIRGSIPPQDEESPLNDAPF